MTDALAETGIIPSVELFFGYVSAAASVVATVTIVAFFIVGRPWGTINDFAYGVMALAILPILIAIRNAFGPSASRKGRLILDFGLASFASYMIASFLITLQGVGAFRYDGLGSFLGLGLLALQWAFFVIIEIWLLMSGSVVKAAGIKNAIRMTLVGATVVGYPLWAIWLARISSYRAQNARSQQ